MCEPVRTAQDKRKLQTNELLPTVRRGGVLQNRWIRRAAVAVLLVVHFLFAFCSARIKSPTIDEYTYIATGYYYVKTGDFRLDRTHPPLIRLLTGLPLQFMDLKEPDPQIEKWDSPASYELGYYLGKEMLLEKGNPVQSVVMAARWPILLLSCGLGGLIYLWAKKIYGTAGGLCALFLYVLCPNMLAHAGLATLDLGISFFLVLALYTLYGYTCSPTMKRWVVAGVALGLALMAKVTALILIPVFVGALAWTLRSGNRSLRAFPIGAMGLRTGILILSVLAVLCLVYGYPRKPFFYIDTLQNVIEKSVHGGRGGEEISGMPHRNYAFYLCGDYSTNGWPYYYLVAVAVKTPLSLFMALFLYLAVGSRRWRGMPDALLVGTMILLHGLAAANRVNIGLRHILPFYPLLYLYLGRIGEWANCRSGRWILFVLGIAYAASCVSIYPDFLAYFNWAAGGPERGHLYLDDSNIDWGQDLGRLAAIRERYSDEPFYIAQSYIFDPAAYGFSAIPLREEQIATPPAGIVAVGKHWAIRHRLSPRSPFYFDWLERYQPIGNVGHSIWLFRFEKQVTPE